MVIDPVCKMEVDDVDPEQSVQFEGTSYSFCSPTCREAFTREPLRYVKHKDVPVDPEAAA
ncbi:MAG TPA: YHS domain-containing protein [Terriglobales bacterium]|nr:YHS domain-containing protein [Terriglobales bacterium]